MGEAQIPGLRIDETAVGVQLVGTVVTFDGPFVALVLHVLLVVWSRAKGVRLDGLVPVAQHTSAEAGRRTLARTRLAAEATKEEG